MTIKDNYYTVISVENAVNYAYKSETKMLEQITILHPAHPEQKEISFDDQMVAGHQRKDEKGYRFCLLIDGKEVAYQRFSGIEAFEQIDLRKIFESWQASSGFLN